MKRDDIKTIVVVFIICIVCVIIVLCLNRQNNFEIMTIVDDYSEFFSINREVNKYIDSVASKDTSDVINLLSDEYVEEHNLNYDNLFEKIDNYPDNSTLSSNGMKSVSVGKNTLYYVTGKIIENAYDRVNVVDDNFKVIVLNDTYNKTFAIYLVDDNDYEKEINKVKKINIIKNSSNDMIVNNNLTDIDVCKLYFSNYISILNNNLEEAYELLDDNFKKKFSDYKGFKEYVQENRDRFAYTTKLCNVEKGKKNAYSIIDNKGNEYYFVEEGVLNYKVKFYLKEIIDDTKEEDKSVDESSDHVEDEIEDESINE